MYAASAELGGCRPVTEQPGRSCLSTTPLVPRPSFIANDNEPCRRSAYISTIRTRAATFFLRFITRLMQRDFRPGPFWLPFANTPTIVTTSYTGRCLITPVPNATAPELPRREQWAYGFYLTQRQKHSEQI